MMTRRHGGPRTRMLIGLVGFALASPTFAGAAPPCTKAEAVVDHSVDQRATEEIERRIAADDTVAPLAGSVTVTTAAGVVTLRGRVSDDEDRLVLASLAESAPGVRRVEDELEVRR